MAVANINDFITSFSTELSRPCNFEVEIIPPSKLANIVGTGSIAKFRCEQAELPARAFVLIDQKTYGPVEHYPVQNTYNKSAMTFICGDNMKEKLFFDAWMELISGKQHNGVKFDFEYKVNYCTDIKITQMSIDGKESYTVYLVDAFPAEVYSIPLSWGQMNDYNRLNVVIAYRYFKVFPAGSAGEELSQEQQRQTLVESLSKKAQDMAALKPPVLPTPTQPKPPEVPPTPTPPGPIQPQPTPPETPLGPTPPIQPKPPEVPPIVDPIAPLNPKPPEVPPIVDPIAPLNPKPPEVSGILPLAPEISVVLPKPPEVSGILPLAPEISVVLPKPPETPPSPAPVPLPPNPKAPEIKPQDGYLNLITDVSFTYNGVTKSKTVESEVKIPTAYYDFMDALKNNTKPPELPPSPSPAVIKKENLMEVKYQLSYTDETGQTKTASFSDWIKTPPEVTQASKELESELKSTVPPTAFNVPRIGIGSLFY